MLEDLVAHGQKSGDNHATRFSNAVGSHQSSIGLFRTAESYSGKHGYRCAWTGWSRASTTAPVSAPSSFTLPTT